MPLRIHPHQRLHIIERGRATVRPPSPDEAAAVAAVARETRGRSEGIPMDVLLTLEAVRQLAEQGNKAAQWLYERERARLGIDRPLHSYTRDPG